MEAKEINKEIAKIIYGKDIVIDDEHGLIASSKERLLESLRTGFIGAENINKGEPESFCLEIPDYCGNIKSAIFLLKEMSKTCKVNVANDYYDISGMNGWVVGFERNNEWRFTKDENISKAICLTFIWFNKE